MFTLIYKFPLQTKKGRAKKRAMRKKAERHSRILTLVSSTFIKGLSRGCYAEYLLPCCRLVEATGSDYSTKTS